MKRATYSLFLVVVLAWTLAVTVSDVAGQGQGQGKGGGNGGGGGSEPHWVLEMTINDGFEHEDPIDPDETVTTRIVSDGKSRALADDDGDGFLELTGDSDLLVDYQDHRLAFETSGTHPDPCALFDLSTESSPGRTTLQLSRRSDEFSPNIRCDLSTDPPYANDDERTFTLVFDKTEGPAGGDFGGACACDRLAYVTGIPGARTAFIDGYPTAGFCALAIAPGEIVPGGENSGLRITAWPFEDLLDSKKAEKRAGQTADGKTTVHILFRTDVANLDDQTQWVLSSQGEDIRVDAPDADTRVITAESNLFDLNGPDQVFGGSGQCSNVSMSFQLTVQRFDLNAGS